MGRLEQPEVRYELVFGPYLPVVYGLGLPVVHGLLLHPHEGGIAVGLGIRVPVPQDAQALVVLGELVDALAQLPYLPLLLLAGAFCPPPPPAPRRRKAHPTAI